MPKTRKHRAIPDLSEAQIAHFWDRVAIGKPDECWPWEGLVNNHGYGTVAIGHATHYLCSRVALKIATGVDPGDSVVMHSCDNPPCCNPGHISAGTMQENMDDAIAKGRYIPGAYSHLAVAPHGEDHYKAKLTDEVVRDTRKYFRDNPTASVSDKADELGISQPTLSEILHYKTWSHVEDAPGDRLIALTRTFGDSHCNVPKGEGHYNRVLDDDTVRQLRKHFHDHPEATYRGVAKEIGVSVRALWAAVTDVPGSTSLKDIQ